MKKKVSYFLHLFSQASQPIIRVFVRKGRGHSRPRHGNKRFTWFPPRRQKNTP